MMAVLKRIHTSAQFVILAAMSLTLFQVDDVAAQWTTKWLTVGDLHKPYASGGAETENIYIANELMYPGIHLGESHHHWKGLWISVKNLTDENGNVWDVRTSHIGPRGLGIGEMFDVSHRLIARFEKPLVSVDGLETFNRPVTVDEVRGDLGPDQMVESIINTSVGITTTRRAMQWSDEYHDNYHIVEYTFTYTGNTDKDEAIELDQETVEGVYFTFLDRPKAASPAGSGNNSTGGGSWGQMQMNDAVGAGLNDYGTDFRAQFSWQGAVPGRTWNTLGQPMWLAQSAGNALPGDTLGRLAGADFYGQVTLHADKSATDKSDDPEQPRVMSYVESDWSDITTGNDHTNVAKMELERGLIECGARGNPIDVDPECQKRTWPTQAYLVMGATDAAPNSLTKDDFANQTNSPDLGRAGGWGFVNSYGPYTLNKGESVTIVIADVVAGLSEQAAGYIGRAYRKGNANDDFIIPYDADGNGVIEDDERLTKNQWVMTARDSLFKSFEMARQTYQAGYKIPEPPRPPTKFEVTSGTDQISLTWEPASGGPPVDHYEIYRAQNAYYGVVTALSVGADGVAIPDSSRAYRCIAGCPGTPAITGNSYLDTDVARGVSYFYYIQAVGQPNTDPTAMMPVGVPLRSSRYYSQTYEPAFLRRAPGNDLADIRIVPNPYNLAATEDVRFGDRQDKLAFYGLPARATIKIYSELGELIETLEHTDGSGDEFWFMTTSSRQLIVSGVYFAVIEDKTEGSDSFGSQVIRKFIIIR